MNYGDKVKYCIKKKYSNLNYGECGNVISESLDGSCILVRFKHGIAWALKDDVEVI